MTDPVFAIYGATGHTGRLVAAELHARGRQLVLSGRDGQALDDLAKQLDARSHPAAVDDPVALRELTDQATVLIHCAGPFKETGEPVAAAAVAGGCHYIDHALEPHHVKRLFDFEPLAQRQHVTMIPSMSFCGGFGDLLAAAVADGLSAIDRLVVAYSITGWRLTTGALNTARHLFAETERISFTDGAIALGYVEPRNAVFPFPAPLGPRRVIAPVPYPEVLTVPRHTPVREVEVMLTARTFEEDDVFNSADIDPEARAATEFTIAVQAISAHGGYAGHLGGRDLWRAAALASVTAADRLAFGEGPGKAGVLTPAEAFRARPFLHTLEQLGAITVAL
ncbi:saccharopine dehydrogenase NADP-binding domain-containing protein [Nocardia arthritidis]|uniref:NAD(P)H-binding protein n=1 Tax=Nocardia arthritidis TaxID=228602 RepID=A0A6G9YIL2_9NOCA|nr:saccharopine dehydrogenase NADP-binding domain-containing protein [Nocardia arthritidis]QIS13000.1 NAD(P)H-binding protein [Nocardia arthritidis]